MKNNIKPDKFTETPNTKEPMKPGEKCTSPDKPKIDVPKQPAPKK